MNIYIKLFLGWLGIEITLGIVFIFIAWWNLREMK